VRDECPTIIKVCWVEGFVFSLSKVDKLKCIVQGPIGENDEDLRGFQIGFSWQWGLGWREMPHCWDTVGSV